MERVQQAEAHALAESRAVHHVPQPQRVAHVLEGAEHLRGVHDRLDQVDVLRWSGGAGASGVSVIGVLYSTTRTACQP